MKGSTWRKVSFEDLNISLEREKSSDALLGNKSNEKKKQSKQTKTKNTPPLLETRHSVSKQILASKPPQLAFTDLSLLHTNGAKTKNSEKEKFGTASGKDKTKSFVSHLRANTWSPKHDTRTPEFDSIELLHKHSEQLEEVRCYIDEKFDKGTLKSLQELSYTESLYLPDPKGSFSLPKKSSRDKSPRFEDNNRGSECLNLAYGGVGDTNPRIYDKNPKIGHDMPRVLHTNTYEDKHLGCQDTTNSRPNITFEDHGLMDPGFDQRFANTRQNSHFDSNIPNGRFLLPPRNGCDKKNCSKLSPNCTHRIRALSSESLPRVPLGKVNLIQAGTWQRLPDNDSPGSRSRSFTH